MSTFDDDFNNNYDEDCDSEIHADTEGSKLGPTINTFTVSKKFRSVNLP